MSKASKLLTLLATSVLLIGCTGMYGSGYKAKPGDADKNAVKNITDNVSSVSNAAASRANQASQKP